MNLEKANDLDNFFYNSGLHIGLHFGSKSMNFRHKVLQQFTAFVNAYGGPDRFGSSREAVKHFLRKTKGGTHVFTKY